MDEHKPERMQEGNDNKNTVRENLRANWFRKFQYDPHRDPNGDNPGKDNLLIIATLIAAVMFQAVVNPPCRMWQDNEDGHLAGRGIYSAHQIAFYVFLVSNTFVLSTSLLVIGCLTYKFPLYTEIWVASASMMVTYASAIIAVMPNESVRFRYVLIAGALPAIVQCILQMYGKLNNRRMESPDGKSQQRGAPHNAGGNKMGQGGASI